MKPFRSVLAAFGLAFGLPAFAAQTVLLAPGQTAADSTHTTVTSSGTLAINGGSGYNAIDLPVYLISGSGIAKVGDLKPWPGTPTIAVGPGEYYVSRPNITAYGQDVGVTIDLATGFAGGSVTQGTSPWVTTGAGGTFPVTGTFWQVTQPVSCAGCFASGGSIGNTGFNVTGTLPAFAATPTVNLGTISTAATSAKQPSLGTAGTASSDVITVQGIASMTPLLTSSVASATGGWSSAYTGNVTNTAVAVNASAGAVGGFSAYNGNTTVCYLQWWNTAQGSVTVGTTAPYRSIGIPAYGGAAVSYPQGIVFSTATTVAATTTRAGSTACTNGLDIVVDYK